MSPEQLTQRAVFERLAPGTPLRSGLERIIQQGNGALVVLGGGGAVDEICTGGFELADSNFSPARLAELAKMDGAVVLSDDCSRILRANVHLVPSSTIRTEETGARHRTAERVAVQTEKPVVAVSEDRRAATVFFGQTRHELENPTELVAKANQSLQTLERFRRRLDDALERLTRLEVGDVASNRAVVTVVQRAELVRRLGAEIDRDAVNLGASGEIIRLQLADLVQGVETQQSLTLRDYLRPSRTATALTALDVLGAMAVTDLNDPSRVAAAVGLDELDDHVRPLGYRLLASVPRLPENVRNALTGHFKDFQKMLLADVAELDDVEGIGTSRAVQLRRYFDRLLDATRAWAPEIA
jgi:diadenylate cyclase